MWHVEIPETSAAAVAEWVAHISATELASIVRINDTPYYLTRHRVGWSEEPYDVILAAWGPAPLRQRLTPWSIQVEIRQSGRGTDVVARCNAGDDLLEQFNLLTSVLQERWPSAKAQTSTVRRTDHDPDKHVSHYLTSSADLFIDWLAERVESSPPPQAPGRWEMRPHPPRVHRRPTLTTLAIDVDILEPDRGGDEEDTLRRFGHYPDAITFEARSYSLHDRDAVRVEATCRDPYRASYEAVTSLQAALGRGKTDRWPSADPWPLVAFFDALWEEIEDVWPRPREGVPPANGRSRPAADDLRRESPQHDPDWLPLEETLNEKWKPVWRLWLKMEEEYRDLWDRGRTDDPEPRIEELSDRVKGELGWTYSNRRLRDIVRAGKEGWLDRRG